MSFQYREAQTPDIPAIQVVRNSVKENMLSDPSIVTDKDCETYINQRGKGWVCESGGAIVGFAIADLQDNNIWALFVHPGFEGKGIGRELQRRMLDWYFQQGKDAVWLGTAPGTRAASFYTMCGWKQTGVVNKGELQFEMSAADWNRLRS